MSTEAPAPSPTAAPPPLQALPTPSHPRTHTHTHKRAHTHSPLTRSHAVLPPAFLPAAPVPWLPPRPPQPAAAVRALLCSIPLQTGPEPEQPPVFASPAATRRQPTPSGRAVPCRAVPCRGGERGLPASLPAAPATASEPTRGRTETSPRGRAHAWVRRAAAPGRPARRDRRGSVGGRPAGPRCRHPHGIREDGDSQTADGGDPGEPRCCTGSAQHRKSRLQCLLLLLVLLLQLLMSYC